MNKYCLYYLPPNSGDFADSLFVFFGGNKVTTKNEQGEKVDKVYHQDILIGYVIKNFSNYCKLRVSGEVFLPNDEMVDLINDILTDEGLENIEYLNESGFYVGKIISKKQLEKSYLYEVDIKTIINVESTFDLDKDDYVVIALNDTYLFPGRMIQAYEISKGITSGGRICSNVDLNMEPLDLLFPIVIEEKVEIGQDFFKVERRNSDA